MNNIRKKILNFMLFLQSQTELPLWKLANEKVCYAAATGEKIEWGPKLRILNKIMRVANKIYLSDIIIILVGLLSGISIWWQVKKKGIDEKEDKQYKRIFLEFGASSEGYLYNHYASQSHDKIHRINWCSYHGIAELGCPTLRSIISLVLKNGIGYSTQVKSSAHSISMNATNFMTVYAINLGIYAFYRAFWKIVKTCGIQEVAVLALDTPVYACVDEGIDTVYFQHGLMALSIPIPKLKRINAVTKDEEIFLNSTLSGVEVYRKKRLVYSNKVKNNILMILSLNATDENRLEICNPLIVWAKKAGLKLVVRPTPKITGNELSVLQERIPEAECDDLSVDFHHSLETRCPKLVAAWTSTGLATALEYDCLPISLYDPERSSIWNNIIYPMKDRLLFWPRDRMLIEKALQSVNAYQTQINVLQSHQDNLFYQEVPA